MTHQESARAMADHIDSRVTAGLWTVNRLADYIAAALTDARREAFVDGFNAGLCGIDKFGEQHETAEEGYDAWLRQRAAAEEGETP